MFICVNITFMEMFILFLIWILLLYHNPYTNFIKNFFNVYIFHIVFGFLSEKFLTTTITR